MTEIILTQYSGKILGPIAQVLGYILNYIYIFLDSVFNIQNIGLCIILFTIIIYICLLPLTIKQQKFSKLSQKMQPEIQIVQAKYKGKKDQVSMQAMQQETSIIYEKYGVSPSGSCIQLVIQMPILLALYRVIYNIPAYVPSIKETFSPVVEGIMKIQGYQDTMSNFLTEAGVKLVKLNFGGTALEASNSIIDVIYKMPLAAWDTFRNTFSGLSSQIDTLEITLEHFNNFVGINIGNAPLALIKSAWANHQYFLVIAAVLVPTLSAATQMLNMKLMPQAAPNSNGNDTMANSMKTMNYMMPIMSFFMVFSIPVGVGLYWIVGSVIRSIQQVLINKHMEKINLDDIIEKNQEKAKKKRAKKGIVENKISNTAKLNTRNINDVQKNISNAEKEKKLRDAVEYSKNAKPDSLAAKANMVREFNERNNK
ncbi:YidC/Oxa1 family membrane protein insertase [Lachnospiraceae bacterium ZAX-1]